jgi:hypothetical protein
MIKLLEILTIILTASGIIHSQNTLQFTILDSTTHSPIPYVIILSEKSIFYTDSLGKLRLKEESIKGKNIEIHCLGYESKLLTYEIDLNEKIFLKPKINLLSELAVSSKARKIKIGDIKNNESGTTDRHGDLTAMFFNKPNENTFFIDKLFIPYCIKGKSVKTKLRIHILSVGEDKAPDKELLNQNIILTPLKKKGILEVNIESSNIVFPKEGIFVGIEWLYPEDTRMKTDGTVYENDLFVSADFKQKDAIIYRKSFVYTKNKWIINRPEPEKYKHSLNIGLELTEKY